MNSLVTFWSELNLDRAPYIHPCDLEVFGKSREFSDRRRLNHKRFVKSNRFPDDGGFHFSLLPVPYVGDLKNADIFILLLNPGFNISNYQTMDDPKYRKLAIRNLRQDFRGVEFPFMSLNPALSSSAGFQWWHAKFAKIIYRISEEKGCSYLDAMSVLAKRVAAIEMVPYRSKSFKANRLIKGLPSAIAARDFVQNELLAKAKKKRVTIIVTRKAREWDISPQDAIVYEGGHTRGAHLGPNTKGGRAILRRLGINP